MNLEKLFSELKRRNIYKVAITYFIVAWLLIQIVATLLPTYDAPIWVMKTINLIVMIGFPVALIFAWAFEMSPEGIKRTTSIEESDIANKENNKQSYTSILLIGSLLLIIVGQYIFNNYWDNQDIDTANIEKTIAVLPFKNDSKNEENLYFCNGIMEGILDHLSKIPELVVISRTSVEQYRDNPPSSKVIAEELGVKYLVEGSVQRIGDRALIFAQLIYAEDDSHLWSQKYNEDLTELFAVQADVTESIADKLHAIISPSVKDRILSIPTKNTLAYDYYLQGNELRFKADVQSQENEVWMDLLDKAQLLYELAIEKDSLLAQAYVGLAFVNLYRDTFAKLDDENYLEEVLTLANKALLINSTLSDAYTVRANYYSSTNQIELAKKDYEKVLELNPNKIDVLYLQATLYRNFEYDFIKSFQTLQKIDKRVNSVDERYRLYQNYNNIYAFLGNSKMQEYYLDKMMELKPFPLIDMWWFYTYCKRHDDAISYVLKYFPKDNQTKTSILGASYYQNGENEKALEYYEKLNKQLETEDFNSTSSMRDSHRYGYVLISLGQEEKGMEMIQRQIEINKKIARLERGQVGLLYDLAGIYSYLGEKEKANYWMKEFENNNGWLRFSALISFVKIDLQFDSVRDDQQFKDWVNRGDKVLEQYRKEAIKFLELEKLTVQE
jgi:TolB-like protein/Tfp pilus assembly protein PilF